MVKCRILHAFYINNKKLDGKKNELPNRLNSGYKSFYFENKE